MCYYFSIFNKITSSIPVVPVPNLTGFVTNHKKSCLGTPLLRLRTTSCQLWKTAEVFGRFRSTLEVFGTLRINFRNPWKSLFNFGSLRVNPGKSSNSSGHPRKSLDPLRKSSEQF